MRDVIVTGRHPSQNMRPILKQSSSTSFSVDYRKNSIDQSVNENYDKSQSKPAHRRVTFSPFTKHSHRRKRYRCGESSSQNKSCTRGKSRSRVTSGMYRKDLKQSRDQDRGSGIENVRNEEWNERLMIMEMLFRFAQMHSKSLKEKVQDAIRKYTSMQLVIEWFRMHANKLKVFTRKEKALLSGRRNRAISRSIQRRNILPRTVENSINYKTSAASKFDRPLRLKKAHEGCFKAFVNSSKETLSSRNANEATLTSISGTQFSIDALPGLRRAQNEAKHFL